MSEEDTKKEVDELKEMYSPSYNIEDSSSADDNSKRSSRATLSVESKHRPTSDRQHQDSSPNTNLVRNMQYGVESRRQDSPQNESESKSRSGVLVSDPQNLSAGIIKNPVTADETSLTGLSDAGASADLNFGGIQGKSSNKQVLASCGLPTSSAFFDSNTYGDPHPVKSQKDRINEHSYC